MPKLRTCKGLPCLYLALERFFLLQLARGAGLEAFAVVVPEVLEDQRKNNQEPQNQDIQMVFTDKCTESLPWFARW